MKKNIFKIGFSTALSGVEQKHGEANVEAVKIAFDEFKNSEHNFELDLIIDDDGADTHKSIEVANKFSADASIIGIIGPNGSNAAKSAAPIYNDAKLAQVTFTASLVELTEKGYKTFFRIIPNDDIHAKLFIQFIEKYLQAKEILFINDDTEFAIGLNQYMAKYARVSGIRVVGMLEIREGADLTKQIASVKKANPSHIFFSGMEPICHQVAVDLREEGLKSIYLGTDAIKPSKFLATPGYGNIEGPFQSNVCADLYRNKGVEQFAQKYKERFGEIYSVYTAEAYVAAKLMIQAAKECFPHITRENVLKKIKAIRMDSIIGNISFQENGEPNESRMGFYKFVNQDELEFVGFSTDLF